MYLQFEGHKNLSRLTTRHLHTTCTASNNYYEWCSFLMNVLCMKTPFTDDSLRWTALWINAFLLFFYEFLCCKSFSSADFIWYCHAEVSKAGRYYSSIAAPWHSASLRKELSATDIHQDSYMLKDLDKRWSMRWSVLKSVLLFLHFYVP